MAGRLPVSLPDGNHRLESLWVPPAAVLLVATNRATSMRAQPAKWRTRRISAMLERLKRRLSLTESDKDELLEDLLDASEGWVKGYTGRTRRPLLLDGVVVELAAGAYNRLGLEGEDSHSEGGVSMRLDGLPKHLATLLDMYRLAKVGG